MRKLACSHLQEDFPEDLPDQWEGQWVDPWGVLWVDQWGVPWEDRWGVPWEDLHRCMVDQCLDLSLVRQWATLTDHQRHRCHRWVSQG